MFTVVVSDRVRSSGVPGAVITGGDRSPPFEGTLGLCVGVGDVIPFRTPVVNFVGDPARGVELPTAAIPASIVRRPVRAEVNEA